jgi:hypothetical protein
MLRMMVVTLPVFRVIDMLNLSNFRDDSDLGFMVGTLGRFVVDFYTETSGYSNFTPGGSLRRKSFRTGHC